MNRKLHISVGFILLAMAALLSACADSHGSEPSYPDKEGSMRLRLSGLMPSAMSTRDAEETIESIESLRIILTDIDGKVKANDLITFDNSEDLSDFSYQWELTTKFGEYRLYAIANEASVENYSVEGEENGAASTSFPSELNRFTVGHPDFEKFINKVYFKPDYTKAIPMSCAYSLNFVEDGKNFDVYLVNVATKFVINFKNLRNDPVVFNSVTLGGIADLNYLMARIPEEYQYRDNQYWIEWLHDTSEDTNRYPDLDNSNNSNNLVNDRWGWLTNYEMPPFTSHSFIDLIADEDAWEVPGATAGEEGVGSVIAGTKTFGPFYFPESKYLPEKASSQTYSILFEIQGEDGETVERSAQLPYLKTLFRQTYMVINVEMTNVSEDIYVEIIRWTDREPSYGTIVPE